MVQNTLDDIRNKVRRITGRPSPAQITNAQIDNYINTFYIYDFPEHLRLESLRVNYQFVTQANTPVYDFDTSLYLTNMPPVYIGGYQTYMTQSRSNFFRNNPQLNFMQTQVYTGSGLSDGYTGAILTSTPILQGFKPNPSNVLPKFYNWNVLVSGQTAALSDGIEPWVTLIDDGNGNLVDINDASLTPTVRGTINYISGAININSNGGFTTPIPSGNPINVQYTPYVASRPQSVCFYQDQFYMWPIPDQAYTVSFEAYKYPTELLSSGDSPQLKEWWQLLAYGAADKIFTDNADMENAAKFRPLLDEQMRLCLRRTIVQQTSERTATIYTEQSSTFAQWPFGNNFSGF